MSQIFKSKFPKQMFIDFLNKTQQIQEYNLYFYVFTFEMYKKLQYNQTLTEFLNSCKPYYHQSKMFYINREMSYVRFLTILRQLCHNTEMKYKTGIKYEKSTYKTFLTIEK